MQRDLKAQLLSDLRSLPLDRESVRQMRLRLADLEADLQQELPAGKREALLEEQIQLCGALSATAHHVSGLEELLRCLPEEEQLVLDAMLINPWQGCVASLTQALSCETSSLYRLRERAIRRLGRLRYGVLWTV